MGNEPLGITTTTTQKVNEMRIATVGRAGARCAQVGDFSFPIWTGKIYEAKQRQSDERWQWRLVTTFGGDRSGYGVSKRFKRDLQDKAEDMGLAWVDGVSQNDMLTEFMIQSVANAQEKPVVTHRH
jgi:hypothetical protein